MYHLLNEIQQFYGDIVPDSESTELSDPKCFKLTIVYVLVVLFVRMRAIFKGIRLKVHYK